MDERAEAVEAARLSGDWQRVLALAPEDPEAHFQMGNRAMRAGRPAAAAAHYRHARAAAPAVAAVAANLIAALIAADELTEAVAEAEAALPTADPLLRRAAAAALAALATDRQANGDHSAAAGLLDRALRLVPGDPARRNNLGLSLIALGRVTEALDELRDIDEPAARRNFAQALQRAGRHEHAREVWAAVVAESPDDAAALCHLWQASLQTAVWTDIEALAGRLQALAAAEPPPLLPLFALAGLPVSPTRVAETIADARKAAGSPLPARPVSAGPPLTVGYLSPDLRAHSVGRSLAAVFAAHDRRRVRTIGYALGSAAPDPAITAGLDRVVVLGQQSVATQAATIAADGVDILVDLAGPTREGALDLLALRPAPLSAHWFGYGSSLGGLVDYLISDAVHTALGTPMREALVHLPGSFLVGPRPPLPAVAREAQGLPADAPVLMNLNAPYKTQPAMFAAWLRILRRAPGAVLWLLDAGEPANRRLRRAAGDLAERLVFAPATDHATHLARQTLADLALDTWPHGGGVSTLDALAAGVPVVTLAGPTPASRLGASLLAAAGLEDLICADLDSYVDLALGLLHDAGRRRTLRPAGRLFDAGARARQLETAFAIMAERCRAGLPPADFTVPDDGD